MTDEIDESLGRAIRGAQRVAKLELLDRITAIISSSMDNKLVIFELGKLCREVMDECARERDVDAIARRTAIKPVASFGAATDNVRGGGPVLGIGPPTPSR